jgi:transcriptional regulator with XRE-family HTH domain
MSTLQKALTLRTKKIGILMMDARRTARQTPESCAQVMQVSLEEYRNFEYGEIMPSLPQLEVLAYFLDIPLEHFWGNKATSEGPLFSLNTMALLPLRNRVIGITLRQLRQNAEISAEDFAAQVDLDPAVLNRYELGEEAIPLPLLEQLLAALNENISIVADQHGQIGKWYKQQKAVGSLETYPVEIQDFVAKSINEPYLELAKKLSELDAKKLRSIAEGLLEITY